MKVAFVNTSYQLGGAETVIHDLMRGCTTAGHQTRLYVAAGKTYPDRLDVVPLYPRLLSRLHHSRLRPLVERSAPRAVWTDRRLGQLASEWPDLIHLHNWHGDYARLETVAMLARRKPFVWTLHAHWGITGGCEHPIDCRRFEDACGSCPRLGVWPVGAADSTAEQLLLKVQHLGDLDLNVIAPSRYLAERITRSRVSRRWRVHHIPNGVSPEAFSPDRKQDRALRATLGLDPEAAIVLVVNRNFADPDKGFPMIREALRVPPPAGMKMQIVLAGENSVWAATQVSDAYSPLSLGYVWSRTQLISLFEASDIFLFASAAENFPCVILEAMASGCCIVSTPTSGVTEQLEDGVTGVLASGMSGSDLGRAFGDTLQHRGRWPSYGAAARADVAKRFTIAAMLRRHLELYGELALSPPALHVPAAS